MKIELKPKEPIEIVKNKFPLLAKGKHNKYTYLFTSPTESLCLGLDARGPVFFQDGLGAVTNIADWEILPPGTQVILTQE